LGPWLERHQPKIEYPKIQTIVKQLRANKDHKYVGAVGLCQEGADPSVDVGVALHPVQAKVRGDYEKIAKPFSIQIGDLDDFLPRPDQEKVAEIFKNKKDCEIVIHQGQVHGFKSRGDLSIEKDRKAKELCVENVFPSRFVSDVLDDQVFETIYEVIADIVSLWKVVQKVSSLCEGISNYYGKNVSFIFQVEAQQIFRSCLLA